MSNLAGTVASVSTVVSHYVPNYVTPKGESPPGVGVSSHLMGMCNTEKTGGSPCCTLVMVTRPSAGVSVTLVTLFPNGPALERPIH